VLDAQAEGVGVYDQSLGGLPKYMRKVPGWTEIIMRAYLEGMGEFDEEETSGLEGWLKEDVGYFLDSFILFSGFKAFIL